MTSTTASRNNRIKGAVAADIMPLAERWHRQTDKGVVAHVPEGKVKPPQHDPITARPTIMILGRFEAGKSTVLNALLGLADTDEGM